MHIKDLLEIFCYPYWALKTVSLHHGHIHLGALYSLDDPMVELLHLPAAADLDFSIGLWRYVDGEKNITINLKCFGEEQGNSAKWTRYADACYLNITI